MNCELLEKSFYCTLHFLWDLIFILFADQQPLTKFLSASDHNPTKYKSGSKRCCFSLLTPLYTNLVLCMGSSLTPSRVMIHSRALGKAVTE